MAPTWSKVWQSFKKPSAEFSSRVIGMKVGEILRKPIIIEEDETVSRTVNKMARERVRDMFLLRKGKFHGMVTHHSLLDAVSNPESTKIKTFIFRPPVLGMDDEIDKAIKHMLQVGIESVPVVEKNKLKGRVAIEDILKQFSSRGMTAGDIMTANPKFVYEDDTIAHARAVMKNHGISRLLVLNRKGKLLGMVTSSDILRKNVPRKKQRRGAFGSYKTSLLNARVTNCMTSHVETVSPSTDLNKVVAKMIRYNIRLIPVAGNGKPIGLVSRKQIIKLMVGKPEEGILVSISGTRGIESFELETLKQLIVGYIEKIGRKLGSGRVDVKLKKMGHSKFEAKVAAGRGKKAIMAESTAFDVVSAVSQALRRLERKVRHG